MADFGIGFNSIWDNEHQKHIFQWLIMAEFQLEQPVSDWIQTQNETGLLLDENTSMPQLY